MNKVYKNQLKELDLEIHKLESDIRNINCAMTDLNEAQKDIWDILQKLYIEREQLNNMGGLI